MMKKKYNYFYSLKEIFEECSLIILKQKLILNGRGATSFSSCSLSFLANKSYFILKKKWMYLGREFTEIFLFFFILSLI
jgi:hypothetical protein